MSKLPLAVFLPLFATTSACTIGAGAGMHSTAVVPEPPRAGLSASVHVEISFFGVSLDGADDVVFVLDRSGSMKLVSVGASGRDLGMSETGAALASIGGSLVNAAAKGPMPSKLDVAKQELIDTLHRMPDGTHFGVIFFDDEIAALSPTLWRLDAHTRAEAAAFIRGIRPGGSTAAVPAMDLAYRMGAQRIVLLSDGLANDGGDGRDLLADAREPIARGLRIDTVGLGLDQDDALMRRLAQASGGISVTR